VCHRELNNLGAVGQWLLTTQQRSRGIGVAQKIGGPRYSKLVGLHSKFATRELLAAMSFASSDREV